MQQHDNKVHKKYDVANALLQFVELNNRNPDPKNKNERRLWAKCVYYGFLEKRKKTR